MSSLLPIPHTLIVLKLLFLSTAFVATSSALPTSVGAPRHVNRRSSSRYTGFVQGLYADILPANSTWYSVKDWYSSNTTSGSSSPATSYQCFGGILGDYPTMDKWLNFDTLWKNDKDLMIAANTPAYSQADAARYIDMMHDSIVQVANDTLLDARIILAVMLEEVSGT